MVSIEAYFDESGDFDSNEGILAIAGYVIRSDVAKVMDAEWADVLARYNVPYAHMVDCAHGTGVFKNIPRDQRSRLVEELIDLIKARTLGGFSVLVRRGLFEHEKLDPYNQCAMLCLFTAQAIMEADKLDGNLAAFFEAGHARQNSAYRTLTELAKKKASSISFAKKEETRLLQAADLLAWQSVKYIKDLQSKKRPPRKDFLSLMEHRHSLLFLSTQGDRLSILMERWPESDRPKTLEFYSQDKTGKRFMRVLDPAKPTARFSPIWYLSVPY